MVFWRQTHLLNGQAFTFSARDLQPLPTQKLIFFAQLISMPIAGRSLLIAHYSLLIAHCALLIAQHLLLPTPVPQSAQFIMFRVSCKVVDCNGFALTGVPAFMQCRDERYNNIAYMEGFTDSDGFIRTWSQSPEGDNPQDPDSAQVPPSAALVSVIFNIRGCELYRWAQSDVNVIDNAHLQINLAVSQTRFLFDYQLQHLVPPSRAIATPEACMTDACDHQSEYDHISPLSLNPIPSTPEHVSAKRKNDGSSEGSKRRRLN
jgi:hypothetical protein